MESDYLEEFLNIMFRTWDADEMAYMHLTVMTEEYESQ